MAAQRVFIAQHHPEAHFLCGLLEASGIRAEVRGDTLFTTVGGAATIPGATPEVWLADPGELSRALEVVRRFSEGEAPASGGEAWSCPDCGEAHEPQFTACWQCGAEAPEGR
jgi:hypothetical protein